MASECLPVDWCFMGSHVITDPTKRMNLKADYYCCMPCYAARVEHRWKFLRGDGKGKADSDSDSESHPNPEPKKVSPLASAPASSSSSSVVPDPFLEIRSRLSALEERMARQAGRDHNIIESLNRAHTRLDKAGH